MFKPLVTVLMPVYNGERYLREAMDSIIAQTFYDFEFLIIDDGSTDNTSDIIHSYRDGRIQGIENAQGQYIARMDSDDISMPGRLFKQVLFMEGHPEIGVCGSWVNTIGEWYQGQLWELSTEPEEIKCRLLFCTTLSHPSVMVRKKVLETSGLRYDGAYKHAEDYKLWMELAKVTLLANIPEPLVQYRFNQNQVSSKYSHEQMAVIDRIRKEQLHALGIEPTPEEIAIHDMLAGNKCPEKKELAQLADAWICKLVQANELVGYYPKVAFNVFMNRLRTV